MRHKVKSETEEASVDITPMLDIVFIMLIFFIVTATFLNENGVDMTRPDNQEDPKPDPLKKPLRIIVDGRSRVLIDQRDVDLRAIQANVKSHIAEYPGASIVIQADEKSKAGTVVSVLDEVRQTGAPVSVATSE